MTATSRHIEIRAEQLNVEYDDTFRLQCDGVVALGNVIAVLGHNGAGKSTLIKTVLGLLTPNQGTLSVAEYAHGSSQDLLPHEHMAFCPENGAVFSDISVESYLRLWCRLKHGDGSFYRKAGARYLELLHVTPLLAKLGRELSKGQRRRVQTAIGFLIRPKLFLFDEPFDGLDIQHSRELTELIGRESENMSVILSSHRMDVVERLADAVVVLKDGAVIAHGLVDEVCEILCGPTWLIGSLDTPDEALQRLREALPEVLAVRLGSQVSLTGHGLDEGKVAKVLTDLKLLSATITKERSTLTDAMNYHLRTVTKSTQQ